jgi:hypothetical protein
LNQELRESNRTEAKDKNFSADVQQSKFSNYLFTRLIAKKRKFTDVDFRYTIFDTCYLRDCRFDSCDFTGCRFVGTNLSGSSFVGCKFDYVNFERTLIDNDILNAGCPGHENLKMRFARTLRTNYQQLGDAKSANKAIGVELQASEVYLHKAWQSNESYYRKKYAGWKRIIAFVEWLEFRILDFVWGNGESALKLVRAIVFMLAIIAAIEVFAFRDPLALNSYKDALFEAPQVFFGILTPTRYPGSYLTAIVVARLIAFGFFMSIIIKRFNRR